jgi:hypothetical protein
LSGERLQYEWRKWRGKGFTVLGGLKIQNADPAGVQSNARTDDKNLALDRRIGSMKPGKQLVHLRLGGAGRDVQGDHQCQNRLGHHDHMIYRLHRRRRLA